MKKYVILLLVISCSCGPGRYFEDAEYEPERTFNKPMTVKSINGDTATLLTEVWEIEYLVDSEGLEVGERKYFMLSVWGCDGCRTFRATILNTFELHEKKEYRKALHAQHLKPQLK